MHLLSPPRKERSGGRVCSLKWRLQPLVSGALPLHPNTHLARWAPEHKAQIVPDRWEVLSTQGEYFTCLFLAMNFPADATATYSIGPLHHLSVQQESLLIILLSGMPQRPRKTGDTRVTFAQLIKPSVINCLNLQQLLDEKITYLGMSDTASYFSNFGPQAFIPIPSSHTRFQIQPTALLTCIKLWHNRTPAFFHAYLQHQNTKIDIFVVRNTNNERRKDSPYRSSFSLPEIALQQMCL